MRAALVYSVGKGCKREEKGLKITVVRTQKTGNLNRQPLTIERPVVVEAVSKDKVYVLSKPLSTVVLELYDILINLMRVR